MVTAAKDCLQLEQYFWHLGRNPPWLVGFDDRDVFIRGIFCVRRIFLGQPYNGWSNIRMIFCYGGFIYEEKGFQPSGYFRLVCLLV